MIKFVIQHAFNRINTNTFLSCITPLFPDNGRLHGFGRHYQYHKFNFIQRFNDLKPPVPPTFHPHAVLP